MDDEEAESILYMKYHFLMHVFQMGESFMTGIS